jgi:hypothetical protein
LLRLADGDITEDRARAMRSHLAQCSGCGATWSAVQRLVDDLAGPVPAGAGGPTPAEHARHVLRRIDSGDAVEPPRRRLARAGWYGYVAAAAACLVLVAGGVRAAAMFRGGRGEEFAARSVRAGTALQREVGVTVYTAEPITPIPASGAIAATTRLVAGYRNAGPRTAYLLLFAVDSAREVHWLYPAYEQAGTDPISAGIPPTSSEALLPSTVVLGGPAAGPMAFVSIVTREPLQVSAIELLPARAREPAALRTRWPDAAIAEQWVTVKAGEVSP